VRIEDATQVLAKCALFDNRLAGEGEILAWAEAIPDWVEVQDALTAVSAWYRASTRRIMPANLIAEAKRARAHRTGRPLYEGD